jgi:hypothetical protein
MNINLSQISEKFAGYDFDGAARLTGFTKSCAQRITPFMFVSSFLISIGKEQFSLQDWANSLMSVFGVSTSKQSIDKRTSGQRHADFCEHLLKWSIEQSSGQCSDLAKRKDLFYAFNNALAQDSSCLALPLSCREDFPGASSNKGKKCATARVQLSINLLTDQPIDLLITNFRKNDQGDAGRIVPMLQPNDLLIRDQGYFVIEAFQQITEQEAYFLSRLRPDVKLFDPISMERLDLLQICKQKKKRGIINFELSTLIGVKQKMATRLLIQQVPQKVYQERRRKAIKDRHSGANHKPEYLDLLQWQILITNAPVEKMTIKQAMQMYSLRWRIEVIFRCWKSEMKFDKRLSFPKSMKPARAKIIICLYLAYLTLFAFRSYLAICQLVEQKHNVEISIIKWFQFVRNFSSAANSKNLTDEWIDHIARACAYDKRKRRNHKQEMLAHSFG